MTCEMLKMAIVWMGVVSGYAAQTLAIKESKMEDTNEVLRMRYIILR